MDGHGGTPVDRKRQSIDQLVSAFAGDATAAVVAIAHRYGIAVCYHDRGTIEAYAGRALTDSEWERLRTQLDDFDEWLENSSAAEPISLWLHIKLDEAGIAPFDPATEDHNPTAVALVEEVA